MLVCCASEASLAGCEAVEYCQKIRQYFYATEPNCLLLDEVARLEGSKEFTADVLAYR